MKTFDLKAAKRGAAVCTMDGRGVVPVTIDYLLQGPYVFSGIVGFGDDIPDKRVVETWTEHGLPTNQTIGECGLSLMMRDDDYLEKLERGEYQSGQIRPLYENPSNSMGLTKREWFAGMAMAGEMSGFFAGNNSVNGEKSVLAAITEDAVLFADALIEELKKTEK